MADWSKNEVDLIIADYFSMLNDELSNTSYSKTFHRNNLVELLNNRSGASVEFKHRNISAVLATLGLPFIRGYKPLYNYQNLLEDEVIKHLSLKRKKIEPKFIEFAEDSNVVTKNYDVSKLLDSAPERQIISEPFAKLERRPFKINYLEREQNNISLGSKGEELVIEFEKWSLIQNGKEKLAKEIVWVSKDDDGAGFDILSKHLNGKDKYIEVKTTKLSKETPIFFSKNEYEFSKKMNQEYYLYRVFNFSKDPKIFQLNGNFDSFCNKEAVQFKGYF